MKQKPIATYLMDPLFVCFVYLTPLVQRRAILIASIQPNDFVAPVCRKVH